MANTKSAKKAARGSARKREHNSFWRRRIAAAEKSVAGTDDILILKERFSALQKVLDKAVKENVIQKNKAARIKSRFSKKLTANAGTTKPKSKSAKPKPKKS